MRWIVALSTAFGVAAAGGVAVPAWADSTERVSLGPRGVQAQGSITGSFSPSISADGRLVAFGSEATNLVPDDTNGLDDVFVRDR